MARKKAKLCWDDVADLDSRMLGSWGAFQQDLCETVEVQGEGLKELATFIMDSTGRIFTLVYVWHDEDDNQTTVRQRVLLDEVKRGYGREIVFRCPRCERRCTRLALRPYGMGCADCLPIVWGSSREGKCARLARRANTIAQKLGLQSWAQVPTSKPVGMHMRTYVSLLDQRQRVLDKIAHHLVVRRRLRGDNMLHMGNLLRATGQASF
jgi:hypothetical protein